MKNVCKYALLAFIAAALAAVSCTSDMKADLDRIEEKIDANQASLQQQLTAMKTALDAYKNEVAPQLAALQKADEDLLAALNLASGNLTEALAGKVSEEDFQAAVVTFQQAIDKIITDQKAIDNAQDLALSTLVTRVETYKSDLETALDTRITALSTTIGATITALEGRIAANEAAIKTLNEVTIPALAARVTTCEQNIGTLQTDLNAFKQATADNLAAIQAVCNGFKTSKLDVSVYNTFITSFENWKGSVDAHLGSIDTDILALQNLLEILDNELAILKSEEEPGYITLQAYVEGIRSTLQAQIDLLQGSSIDFDTAVKNLNEAVQAKLSALEAEIATLKARVQSLVFVPQYKDLKFGIPFSLLTDGTNSIAIAYNEPIDHFEVVYKVSPDTLAESLAEHAKEVFTFVIEDGLMTRGSAAETAPKLTILNATGDNETGKVAFKLYHENFQATVEGEKPVLDAYAVSLVVADEAKGIHVASEYTGTINVPSPVITVDMKNLYMVNPVDSTNIVAYTKTTNEYTNEMEYIDSTLRYPYKDCFIAANITPVSGMLGLPAQKPHYTYEQLREQGWNMPESSLEITTTATDDKCAFLKHADLANAEFATVNIDSTKALKLVKEHLIGTSDVHTKKLNYAYNNGINSSESATLNMSATITLGKVNKLDFEIAHKMVWTYEIDKLADHKNIGTFTTSWSHENLLSVPVLVKGEEKVLLDGSDAAYGIVTSDFYGKAFTKGDNAVVPSELTAYSYNVKTPNSAIPDSTIVLTSAAISSWGAKVGESKVNTAKYDLAGTYVLPFSKKSNALVTINAEDRDRTPIELTLEPFKVTILGGNSITDGGQYIKGSEERYLIKSQNLADSVYNKFVEQKIFDAAKYTRKNAFGLAEDSEFNGANVVWNNVISADAARFDKVFTNDTQGGSFYLQSNNVELGGTYNAAKHLTSEALRDLSQNYKAVSGEYLPVADATKAVTYSFYSYIGQVVNVNWPLQAVPAEPYKFTTYGALESAGNYYFNISPGTVWYNPDFITRANTELDLIMNGNIQVVTGTNGEGGINPANLTAKGLVPMFRLTDTPEHNGVAISTPTFESNVQYYGQVDSVAVKSALYVNSAETLFYVPGSESMYVNYSDKKIDSVFVRKFNPIAEPAGQVLTGNAVINAGTQGVLPLNMKDINGNFIYKNGYAQSNKGKYHETIKNIFNEIVFTLVSVNGEEQFTGWALVSGNTPDELKLNVPAGIAEGAYTIVVEAHSCWKDYTYTLTIRNGNVSGGIDAGNQDYGNGGSETWK